MSRRWRRRRQLRLTRDSLLFTVGICGIVYETVVAQVDRPTLLLLYGAMIGLPAFFQNDGADPGRKKEQAETVEHERIKHENGNGNGNGRHQKEQG